MRRKSIAKDMGLGDDWDPGTYPSNSVTVESGGSGLLPKLALGAALLGAGSAIPLGLSFLQELQGDKPVVDVEHTLDTDTQYEFGLE